MFGEIKNNIDGVHSCTIERGATCSSSTIEIKKNGKATLGQNINTLIKFSCSKINRISQIWTMKHNKDYLKQKKKNSVVSMTVHDHINYR
jgi:hypothetical protein